MGAPPATLRRATPADRAFAEQLSRDNMATYRMSRNIVWDPARRLYERLGFTVRAEFDGVVHMACKLPIGGPP